MSFKYESIYFDEPIVSERVLDIFIPEEKTRDVAIFFVHGGGWQAGSRTGFHKLMREFNKQGFICASTDYRLMGTGANIFDQIEDVRHGYLLFLNYLAHNNRPLKVFTHGGSAGAHLNALISLAQPGQCGEEIKSLPDIEWTFPIGAALQSTPMLFEPWDDIFPHIWTAMEKIVGTKYKDNPELYKKLAPMNYLSASSCPLLFLEAENEHMFPLEYTVAAVEKLRSFSIEAEYKVYTKAEHGFFYDITRRQQKESFHDMLKFIEKIY